MRCFDIVDDICDAKLVVDSRSSSGLKKRRQRRTDSTHRPYLCMMCPKRFTAAGYLRIHIKQHVDVDPAGVDVEKQHRLRTIFRHVTTAVCLQAHGQGWQFSLVMMRWSRST